MGRTLPMTTAQVARAVARVEMVDPKPDQPGTKAVSPRLKVIRVVMLVMGMSPLVAVVLVLLAAMVPVKAVTAMAELEQHHPYPVVP